MRIRTWLNGSDPSPPSEHIRADDSNVDRHRNDAGPPADDVTNEIDLLLSLALRPEADTAQQERPVDGLTRVGMRRRQARVMLQHQSLKLEELLEEVHGLGFFDLDVGRAIKELFALCQIESRKPHKEGSGTR